MNYHGTEKTQDSPSDLQCMRFDKNHSKISTIRRLFNKNNRKKSVSGLIASATLVWLVIDKVSSTLANNAPFYTKIYNRYLTKTQPEIEFRVDSVAVLKNDIRPQQNEQIFKSVTSFTIKISVPEYSDTKIKNLYSNDFTAELDLNKVEFNKLLNREAAVLKITKTAYFPKVVDEALKAQKNFDSRKLLSYLVSNQFDAVGNTYGAGPGWILLCDTKDISNYATIQIFNWRWATFAIEFSDADNLYCAAGSIIGTGNNLQYYIPESLETLKFIRPTRTP